MSITSIPQQTEAAGELGQAKADVGSYTDPAVQVKAAHWNQIVTRLISIFSEVGKTDGTTPGSINAIVRPMPKMNWAAGAAPTVSDDSSAGYSAGSFWVHPASGLYLCGSATVGAAQWLLILTRGDLSNATPATIADSTGAAGTANTAARADHAHPHGTRGGGTLHATAVAGGAAGFLSGTDKAKIDGLGPLWKWNETDASQFTVGKDEIAGGSPTIAKVSGAHGPVLRVTFPTKATGAKSCLIYINDLTLAQNAAGVRRFVFRFRLCGFSGTAGEWYAVGPAFNVQKGTGASAYGMAAVAQCATASSAVQLTGGTFTYSNGSPNWVKNSITTPNTIGTIFEVEMSQLHNAAPPEWRASIRGHAPQTSQDPLAFTLGASKAAWAADGGMTAFGTTWNALTLDTVGLCFYGFTGATAGQYFEFDCLEVLRHPMDS